MKNLYENTYKERLKHNKMKEGFEELEKNKIKLFEKKDRNTNHNFFFMLQG